MCTGRSPFRADTTVAVLRRVCDDTARPIREVNPDVPEWLVEIIDRLLAKQPEDRFQTAAEVAELLGRHLAHVQDPGSTPFPGRLPAVRAPPCRPGPPPAVLAGRRAHPAGRCRQPGPHRSHRRDAVGGLGHPHRDRRGDAGHRGRRPGRERHHRRRGPGHHRGRPAGSPSQAGPVPGAGDQGRPARQAGAGHHPARRPAGRPRRPGADRASHRPRRPPRLRSIPAPSDYEVRRYVGHTAGVDSVCVSPDGRRILSASDDGTVRLWDLETGAELRCFRGHSQFVHAVAFLPDGKRLVSGSRDRTVRIWDAETGEELQRLTGHRDSVGARCRAAGR